MVLLESPLGGAVERQNRNCGVHENRGDSPTAFRAVPALEMLVFNPRHTFIHRQAYFLDFEYGWNSRQRQGTEEGYQLVRTWEVCLLRLAGHNVARLTGPAK